MHPISIGTCGWSYKDWSGVFYPESLAAADYLAYYAVRFKVVEVDSTFYRSPTPKMVEGWREKTPDGFGFSLKVPQVITHTQVLEDCGTELQAFLDGASLARQRHRGRGSSRGTAGPFGAPQKGALTRPPRLPLVH